MARSSRARSRQCRARITSDMRRNVKPADGCVNQPLVGRFAKYKIAKILSKIRRVPIAGAVWSSAVQGVKK